MNGISIQYMEEVSGTPELSSWHTLSYKMSSSTLNKSTECVTLRETQWEGLKID